MVKKKNKKKNLYDETPSASCPQALLEACNSEYLFGIVSCCIALNISIIIWGILFNCLVYFYTVNFPSQLPTFANLLIKIHSDLHH